MSSLDDKSLNFPVVPSHLTQSLKEFDSGSINSSALHQLKHSHTALDKSSVIAKIYASKLPKINDLKFLTLVSTYQELIGFFGCFNPLLLDSLEEPRNLLDNSLLAVIQKHKKNITEDTHIIGIKHNGEVCIHNWRKCPHCIIAGTTGSGKTNFLFFLVYQILYSNCDSDIFIADFQAGLHFQLIAKQHQHVKMITQHEEFLETLKNLCNLHDERRTSMISNKVRTIEKLYEKTGIKVNRTFLIIDEAFHIDYAENLIKREIEKCLTILASQARVTHIHIVYCSQSPNLFNRQIKANIEGRIVLRVANNNESLGLLDNFSALNLPEGTAIYRDIPYDPKSPTIVKIPYIPDEIWDFPITKF